MQFQIDWLQLPRAPFTADNSNSRRNSPLEPLSPWPPPGVPRLWINCYRMNNPNAHHSVCTSLILGWGINMGSYILTLFCPAHVGDIVLASFKYWFTIEDCICKPNCTPFDVAQIIVYWHRQVTAGIAFYCRLAFTWLY